MNENKFCSVQVDRDHLKTLLLWLHDEVMKAGGDGDAIWYSRFYCVSELLPLIEEINKTLAFPWKFTLEDKHLTWGVGQEWVLITNDQETYDRSADWIQVKIRY